MKNLLKSMLAIVTLTVSTLSGAMLVATPAANASTGTFANQVEASIIKYSNAQRRAHGKRAVTPNSCVDRYAEGWAVHLRTTNRFYHRNLRSILRSCHRSYASENIAKYPVSGASADSVAKATVRMWMNSSGHRRNLLSGKVRVIGVGVQKSTNGRMWIAVQNFSA